jgi:sulfur relay (sulfurtransferase) complex TusBCD TusD component (DsrE family)
MKYLSILVAGLISASVFAGNRLSDNCDGDYIANTYIDSVSYSSNWLTKGPAVNVLVDGVWYGKYVSSDNGDKFTPALIAAYLHNIEVNVCVASGKLRGVEFISVAETKSKNKSLLKR